MTRKIETGSSEWEKALEEGYECAVYDFHALIFQQLGAQLRMDILVATKAALESSNRRLSELSKDLEDVVVNEKRLSQSRRIELAEEINIEADRLRNLEMIYDILSEIELRGE